MQNLKDNACVTLINLQDPIHKSDLTFIKQDKAKFSTTASNEPIYFWRMLEDVLTQILVLPFYF